MKKSKLFLALATSFLSVQVMANTEAKEPTLLEKAKSAFGVNVEQVKEKTADIVNKTTEIAQSVADNVANVLKQDYSKVKESLKAMGVPEEDYEIKEESAVKNSVEVFVKSAGAQLFFFEDGKKVITGKMYEIKDGKLIDPIQQKAFAKMKSFEDSMIIYKADNEKYVVTAFVDITCHYCHLLHKNVKKYNELGITMRYLAYPREGLNGKVAMQMESIFTSNNPKQAMEDAENGKTPTIMKEPNLVKKHYEFGNEFGVTGTPAIITQNGNLIPGYLEPTELLKYLEKDAE